MELRPYQQEAVNAVYEHLREKDNNPCVVLPTGTGKSLVLAQIAKDAITLWGGRVLILAHVKELLEQNSDKIRRMCPELPIGIYSAGLKSRDTEEPVIVAGIQSVYNKADKLGKFDLIMIDECFPAGTLISTPRGDMPIEDLYVGQAIHHALGVGVIEAISSRPTQELIQLELSNGTTIKCTGNHPFFTDRGWCQAKTLAVGSRLYGKEDVSALRKSISTQNSLQPGRDSEVMRTGVFMESSEILQHGLPEKIHDWSQTKSEFDGDRMDCVSQDSGEILSMLRERNTPEVLPWETGRRGGMETDKVLFDILCQESRESDVSGGCGQKAVIDTTTDRPQTENSWGEWDASNFATGRDSTETRADGRNRICHNNHEETAGERCIPLLQDGCCDSVSSSGNSAGWIRSFNQESSRSGQTDSGLDGRIRVVGITHIKLESPRVVFNLQVSGHPTYYADGVLVHNCHLIPADGEGMYRTFLEAMKEINPHVRLIGMTATPFRLKGGLICKPENLLNEICYEAGIKDMIRQGYLSPLIARAGREEAKLDNLHIRGGEFIAEEIAAAMDVDSLTNSACREIVELTKERKSVLIFTASVEHCHHVADYIRRYSGQECAIVTGETPSAERAEIIDRFKGKQIPADLFGNMKPPLKFLCNVNVLTTGFDAPNTDCIVLLRPTASAGLLVQMCGRGTRLSPETQKRNCLVLDFGGNIIRHGPIDMIRVTDKTPGNGDAPAKKCPECFALIHAAYRKCPECGYEFPPSEHSNLNGHAGREGILSGETTEETFDVKQTMYRVHTKRNADPETPKTMRIDYELWLGHYQSEWVCPEHTGYARDKFVRWWKARAPEWLPPPVTAEETVRLANLGYLAEPKTITVKHVAGEKFDKISKCVLGDKPDVQREPGEDWNEDYPSNSPGDLGVAQNDDWDIPF